MSDSPIFVVHITSSQRHNSTLLGKFFVVSEDNIVVLKLTVNVDDTRGRLRVRSKREF